MILKPFDLDGSRLVFHETTVNFIQDISNSISTHSRQFTRPILEHCVRVINQDLSSGKLS